VTEANQLHTAVQSLGGRLIILDYSDSFGLFLIDENRLMSVFAMPKETKAGEIILSRVSAVKKDIGAAFVKLSQDTEAFLKLSNVPDNVLPLKQGDLVPVKIISDEQKGKRISVSAKVNYKKLTDGWKYKSAFNVLYKPDNSLISFIRAKYLAGDFVKIITDNDEIFASLSEYKDVPVELYKDEKLGLQELFSLKTKLEKAVSPKVFLKSGGYLIINHTEALTVIDVNSGKNTPSKKADASDIVYKLNEEAAEEIAMQLKLRNISGMILIDFINMDSEEDKETLIKAMEEFVSKDKVIVKVIDITPLGIMELTRQKTEKPLSEIVSLLN
jgi:Ribonuclease G/E